MGESSSDMVINDRTAQLFINFVYLYEINFRKRVFLWLREDFFSQMWIFANEQGAIKFWNQESKKKSDQVYFIGGHEDIFAVFKKVAEKKANNWNSIFCQNILSWCENMVFIVTNFKISWIFCKIFAKIYFRDWCLLTFFAEFYFRKKGKKQQNLQKLISTKQLILNMSYRQSVATWQLPK